MSATPAQAGGRIRLEGPGARARPQPLSPAPKTPMPPYSAHRPVRPALPMFDAGGRTAWARPRLSTPPKARTARDRGRLARTSRQPRIPAAKARRPRLPATARPAETCAGARGADAFAAAFGKQRPAASGRDRRFDGFVRRFYRNLQPGRVGGGPAQCALARPARRYAARAERPPSTGRHTAVM